MAKPNHLRLVVDNTRADKCEPGAMFDSAKVIAMMGNYFKTEDLSQMKMRCVEIGEHFPESGYWEFIDKKYEYFNFIFETLPRDDSYELNLMRANFFMQATYLSFLELREKEGESLPSLHAALKTLPSEVRKLSQYHAFIILDSNTPENRVEVPPEDEQIRFFVANSTKELLSS